MKDCASLRLTLTAAHLGIQVEGVEYDETEEINVLTDIKFVVMTVSLPLGCQFLLCYLCLVSCVYLLCEF